MEKGMIFLDSERPELIKPASVMDKKYPNGKPGVQKKPPQRGLGVAQLERLRMLEHKKRIHENGGGSFLPFESPVAFQRSGLLRYPLPLRSSDRVYSVLHPKPVFHSHASGKSALFMPENVLVGDPFAFDDDDADRFRGGGLGLSPLIHQSDLFHYSQLFHRDHVPGLAKLQKVDEASQFQGSAYHPGYSASKLGAQLAQDRSCELPLIQMLQTHSGWNEQKIAKDHNQFCAVPPRSQQKSAFVHPKFLTNELNDHQKKRVQEPDCSSFLRNGMVSPPSQNYGKDSANIESHEIYQRRNSSKRERDGDNAEENISLCSKADDFLALTLGTKPCSSDSKPESCVIGEREDIEEQTQMVFRRFPTIYTHQLFPVVSHQTETQELDIPFLDISSTTTSSSSVSIEDTNIMGAPNSCGTLNLDLSLKLAE